MRAKEARAIEIRHYLAGCGIQPAHLKNNKTEGWYSSPLRQGDKTPSFKVSFQKNLRFDFGLGKGGTLIDLVCDLYQINVKEALSRLDRLKSPINCLKTVGHGNNKHPTQPHGYTHKQRLGANPPLFKAPALNHSTVQPKANDDNALKNFAGEKKKKSVFTVLSVKPITQKTLIHYLEQRKISLSIAEHYLKEVHYHCSGAMTPYYAVGIACGDGFEVRSPFFKGFIGTQKGITAINLKSGQSLSIFEGMMDFLAFLTHYQITDFQNSVIILNSTALKKQALIKIQKFHFSKIYLFLDNDDAGRTARNDFITAIKTSPVIDKSPLYQHYKDFNAMLMAIKSTK